MQDVGEKGVLVHDDVVPWLVVVAALHQHVTVGWTTGQADTGRPTTSPEASDVSGDLTARSLLMHRRPRRDDRRSLDRVRYLPELLVGGHPRLAQSCGELDLTSKATSRPISRPAHEHHIVLNLVGATNGAVALTLRGR
jgi:hypothetical protein